MSSAEVLSHHSSNEPNNIENQVYQDGSPTTYQPSLDENVNLVYTQTSQKSDPKSNSNDSPTAIVVNSSATTFQVSSPEEVPRITEPLLRKAISDVQNDLLNSDWHNSPKQSEIKSSQIEKKRLSRMQQLARMEEKLRNIPPEGSTSFYVVLINSKNLNPSQQRIPESPKS
jgi:hypothetical protein